MHGGSAAARGGRRAGGRGRGRRLRPGRAAGAAVALAVALGGALALRHGTEPGSARQRVPAATASSPSTGASLSGGTRSEPSAPTPTAVRPVDLGALLPVPLEGAAAATGPDGRIYLFGGSGGSGFNATVYAFDPARTTVTAVGNLPEALHDAGAAWDGARALVCGGGRTEGSDRIYAFVPGAGSATLAGRLPQPLSDLEGVTAAGRAYCLGGWTGQTYSDAIFDLGAIGAGGAPRVVGRLPHAVRYGAAAALPGGILLAGGRVASGGVTDAIQWVPLGGAAAAPTQVGHLPTPLAYAMAAQLGEAAVVAGGCDASDAPTAGILLVTADGRAAPLGHLAQAVCYGAAAASGGAVYLFGGRTGKDEASVTAHVWKLAPV